MIQITGIAAKPLKIILMTAMVALNVQFAAGKCYADDYNDNYDLNLRQFPLTYDYLKSMFIAPFHFTATNWGKAGLIALGTGLLYTQDTTTRNFFQRNRSYQSDTAALFFIHFGDGSFTAAILSSLYIYGEFNDDDKYKRAGMLGAESVVVNTILTSAIKVTLQRPLPDSGLPYNDWHVSWTNIDNQAFPSGHTSCAFATSVIVATEFSDIPLVPVIAYSVATLTALSMLNENEHWGSDVLPGAALGYYTGKEIESMQKRKITKANLGSSDLVFFPMVSGEGVSLLCIYSF